VKLLCEACGRLSPAAGARVEGQRVYIRCGACGRESEVAVASAERPAPKVLSLQRVNDAVDLAAKAACSEDPFAVPADRCPKCIGERDPDALTCPRCGLVYVNYVPEELAPSSELAGAFRAAMEKWDERPAHDAVLGIAIRTGELSALGRLYRIRQAAAPLDPVARRGLDEVVRRASAGSEILQRPVPRNDGAPRWQKLAVLVVGLAVVFLMFVLLRQLMSA
jgi:predicted  nucleic acid-binding Zn-ribbon protein